MGGTVYICNLEWVVLFSWMDGWVGEGGEGMKGEKEGKERKGANRRGEMGMRGCGRT